MGKRREIGREGRKGNGNRKGERGGGRIKGLSARRSRQAKWSHDP